MKTMTINEIRQSVGRARTTEILCSMLNIIQEQGERIARLEEERQQQPVTMSPTVLAIEQDRRW